MSKSDQKKINLTKEIKRLTEITCMLLQKNKLLQIGKTESPRSLDKIWQKIFLIHTGKNNFAQASRIKKLWTENTGNFVDQISKNINTINKVILFSK